MITIRIPEWKSFIIITGGVSLIILSILWIKKERKKTPGKQENERSGLMKFPNGNQTIEVLNNTVPELPESKWLKVGRVEELCFYPLKSGRGQKLSHCDFTELGISVTFDGCFTLRDRAFAIYDDNGELQAGREYPTQILINLNSTSETCVKLEAVGMPSLVFEVPTKCENALQIAECTTWFGEKVKCIDCGPEAAKWISSFLTGTDSGLRLGYAFVHRISPSVTLWNKYKHIYESIRDGVSVLFPELATYKLISESSVKVFNNGLEKSFPALQFRPNILISGTESYAEYDWEWIKIGGNVIIRNFKPCTRYQGLNTEDEKPLKRSDSETGINCGLYVAGKVKVGDDVYVCDSIKQF